MTISKGDIEATLATITLPTGQNLIAADSVRAVSVNGGKVSFVLEVDAELGPKMEPVRQAAEAAILALDGVESVSALVTAPSAKPAPPDLKIGGHPKPEANNLPIPGVKKIIAIGSGKGGVGKSTVSANIAVSLARQGHKVGLLDADIYGPSQPRILGESKRPASPDGKTIIPLTAHGVTFMSIGLMLGDDQAVVWRGPMLMGALQQMLRQVEWGELDVLLVDLPPGTGDVQLTLAQKSELSGAVIVSTPQDVALIDARKAMNMFDKLNVPIVGLIENMSMFTCPECGHESHIFGHGGAKAEAERLGLPFLGEIPLELEIRTASDDGTPVTRSENRLSAYYDSIAAQLLG